MTGRYTELVQIYWMAMRRTLMFEYFDSLTGLILKFLLADRPRSLPDLIHSSFEA